MGGDGGCGLLLVLVRLVGSFSEWVGSLSEWVGSLSEWVGSLSEWVGLVGVVYC